MEIRRYLDLLKRSKWFIIESVVLMALVVGIVSSLRTPLYEATAGVLLQPDDPSEQHNPQASARPFAANPDRYVVAQREIVRSRTVARQAAKSLKGVTAQYILDRVSAKQRGASDVLEISATDVDPVRARDIANATAKGFIEHRRQASVTGLERASQDIAPRLEQLQARIADLDQKIGTDPSRQGPTVVAGQVTQVLGVEGPADLVAARYATAVQYESLYARQQELLINISLKRGGAEMISEAIVADVPVSPRPKRDAALGAFVGLVFGAGVSFFRDELDDRLRSAQDVEGVTGLPVLAELPNEEGMGRRSTGLAAVERPLGPLTEAVRSLRTSINFLGVDNPIKVIVVASAAPGEGKSLVAANLAAVYAQAGYRTHLVSADLRRPGLAGVFPDSAPSPGLTGVLVGLGVPPTINTNAGTSTGARPRTAAATNAETMAALVTTQVPDLLLLPAGPTPPNPAELLGSRRMSEVLKQLAQAADVVVVDTSALLPVTDAAVLASKADGAVLVTALGETRRTAARRATEILQASGARILGVVVNKVPMSAAFYYGPDHSHGRRHRRIEADSAAEEVSVPISVVPDLRRVPQHDVVEEHPVAPRRRAASDIPTPPKPTLRSLFGNRQRNPPPDSW